MSSKFSNRFLEEASHPAIATKCAALDELEYTVLSPSPPEKKPFFSIIVVIYDTVPSYVADCLSSLESQTCPRESFEVIIIDNGSSGTVRSLIETFYSKQSNCSVLRTSSNFYDYSRAEMEDPTALLWNAGLFASSGEVSYFLSCDDQLSANALEEIGATFKRRPGVATVAPRVHSVDAEGNLNGDYSMQLDSYNERPDYVDGRNLTRSVLSGNPLIGAPGGLLFARVEHVVARGGYDRVNDLTQWLKFAPYGLHGYAREATLFWRHHSGQANKKHAKAGYCHYLNYRELNRNYDFSGFFRQIGLMEEAKKVETFLKQFASKQALKAIRESVDHGVTPAFRASVNTVRESRGRLLFPAIGVLLAAIVIPADKALFHGFFLKKLRSAREFAKAEKPQGN